MNNGRHESPGNALKEGVQLDKLTRQQLKEIEAREKTPFQKMLDNIIMLFPIVCGIIACWEYLTIPDNSPNSDPMTYLGFLIILIAVYTLYLLFAGFRNLRGDKTVIEKVRHIVATHKTVLTNEIRVAAIRIATESGQEAIDFLPAFLCHNKIYLIS